MVWKGHSFHGSYWPNHLKIEYWTIFLMYSDWKAYISKEKIFPTKRGVTNSNFYWLLKKKGRLEKNIRSVCVIFSLILISQVNLFLGWLFSDVRYSRMKLVLIIATSRRLIIDNTNLLRPSSCAAAKAKISRSLSYLFLPGYKSYRILVS